MYNTSSIDVCRQIFHQARAPRTFRSWRSENLADADSAQPTSSGHETVRHVARRSHRLLTYSRSVCCCWCPRQKSYPILVTEHWARSWSRCTSTGDFPGGRLLLLFARPVVTFPAEERHSPLTSTKLYCLVTEAHRCEQLVQGCYPPLSRWELSPYFNHDIMQNLAACQNAEENTK